MVRWEYLYGEDASLDGAQKRLDHLGRQGWELVAVLPHPDLRGGYIFIYKRPLEAVPSDGFARRQIV